MKKNKNKQKVRFRRLNWDVNFFNDIISGNGFIITEPPEVTIDGKRKKSLYGAQSPLYGTSYEDEQSFVERYRCECGKFTSRLFEGETCPFCNTKVEFKDSDINVTGWISLGNNRIISPYYYQILQNAIGKPFVDIVYVKTKVNTDGKIEKITEEDEDIVPTSPYFGIGVDKFYEQYENIIAYFANKKKNKKSTFDTLLKEKSSVFVSHIPIPSTLLRPQSVTSDTYYFSSVDKCINTAFRLSEEIKNCVPVERGFILQRLQKRVNDIWNIYFDQLNGKEGLIRGELLGGSLNYTSRK